MLPRPNDAIPSLTPRPAAQAAVHDEALGYDFVGVFLVDPDTGDRVMRAGVGWTAMADVPVIMLTILDEQRMGFALGPSDYLTKPIDRPRLLAALERCGDKSGGRGVLLVEDDPETRAIMRRTLERAGWEAAEAENGAARRRRLNGGVRDVLRKGADGREELLATIGDLMAARAGARAGG
jgi:CheY-like chemotaxis protein